MYILKGCDDNLQQLKLLRFSILLIIRFLLKSDSFLTDPTEDVSPSLSPEDGNRSSFRNVVFSAFYNNGRWTKPNTPVIPTVSSSIE
jgi:hypothetical protein